MSEEITQNVNQMGKNGRRKDHNSARAFTRLPLEMPGAGVRNERTKERAGVTQRVPAVRIHGARGGSGQVPEQPAPSSGLNPGGTSEHAAPRQTPHEPAPHPAGEGREREKPGFLFLPVYCG